MGDFESCGCDDSRNGRVGELPSQNGLTSSISPSPHAAAQISGQNLARRGSSVLSVHLSCRWPGLGLGRMQRQRGVWGEDFQALCGCFGNGTRYPRTD